MYLITQTRIDDKELRDNPFDDEGRKIKEKQESLMRTLDNVVNVPVNSKYVNNISTKSEIDYYLDDSELIDNNDDFSVDLEEEDRIFEELVNNLKNTYEQDQVVNNARSGVEPVAPVVEPVVESSKTDVKEEEPVNAVRFTSVGDDFDVNSTYTEISEAQDTITSIREKAEQAKRDAEESERILERLILQNEETQRQLKETEKRSRIVEQRLADALLAKKSVLNQEIRKKEIEINNSNMQREKNNSKILEYRDMIRSAENRTNAMNERITKSVELLDSLSNTLNYGGKDFVDSYDEDDRYRKIV